MFVKDNIEFHNAAELVPCLHPNGVALYRYPTEVVAHLTTLGHHAAACSDGVELRFVSGDDWVSLTLSARSNYQFSPGATVRVYRGDMLFATYQISDGATQTIKLMSPPQYAALAPEVFTEAMYGPQLWRIVFSGATVIYHGIDTAGQAIRPPSVSEKPRLRWLGYGSSISNHEPGYLRHASRYLGVDLYNKGLCGACFCEKEAADYLAGEDWDFATLELGVNMRGSVSSVEFEERARSFVETFRRIAPGKPIILLTIFPNGDDYYREPTRCSTANAEFREILRRLHGESGDADLYLLEGNKILTRLDDLSPDLIHPHEEARQRMGRNLADLLRPILAQYFTLPAPSGLQWAFSVA